MGRNAVFYRKFFAKLSSRFHTPQNSLLLTGFVGLLALFLDEESSTSFVNLCVIAVYLGGRVERQPGSLLLWVLLPAVSALFNAWLLASLDWQALTVGGIWLALGIVYLALLTHGFRRPPPEMHMEKTPL